ncbi:MAG: hypothetical protein HY748_07840 [Elusimicrobia bacterium]|nr:hypothetical protein [Elusimicrobiota bacterium]
MRRSGALALLCCFGILTSAGCGSIPEEKHLELRLTLAKRRVVLGESLWYLIQITNKGREPVDLYDYYWLDQNWIFGREDGCVGTCLEIRDPEGKIVEGSRMIAKGGNHMHYDLWTNDRTGYRLPDKGGRVSAFFSKLHWRRDLDWVDRWSPIFAPFYQLSKFFDNSTGYGAYQLLPGETLTATPSMPKPVDYESAVKSLDDMGDIRALPYRMYKFGAISKEKYLSIEKAWKADVEGVALMGDWRYKTDSEKALASFPRGYRILEGYPFEKPGKYRVKAVYNEFDMHVPGVISIDPKRRAKFDKSRVRIESEIIEFEVLPSSWSHIPIKGFSKKDFDDFKEYLRTSRRKSDRKLLKRDKESILRLTPVDEEEDKKK